MIPNLVLLKLQDNEWLQQGKAFDRLNIKKSKNAYTIFEKVFTTISKENNVNWLDIYYAVPDDNENFILLCVCAILIDRYLRIQLFMEKKDRDILLGTRLSKIVDSFYPIS